LPMRPLNMSGAARVHLSRPRPGQRLFSGIATPLCIASLTFMGGPPVSGVVALYENPEPGPPFTNHTTDLRWSPWCRSRGATRDRRKAPVALGRVPTSLAQAASSGRAMPRYFYLARKSEGFPAEKTDALWVEFRSVSADSLQSFSRAQLAAFHELGSNALDGAPHSGLAQDRIAL